MKNWKATFEHCDSSMGIVNHHFKAFDRPRAEAYFEVNFHKDHKLLKLEILK
jgi:hypothetical protein